MSDPSISLPRKVTLGQIGVVFTLLCSLGTGIIWASTHYQSIMDRLDRSDRVRVDMYARLGTMDDRLDRIDQTLSKIDGKMSNMMPRRTGLVEMPFLGATAAAN